MAESPLLTLLKANVGAIGSTIYDTLFLSLLTSAKSAIEREGITLDADNAEDNNLIVGYATWLFQQREKPEMEMPRWLRYNLNNKVLHQRAVSSDE